MFKNLRKKLLKNRKGFTLVELIIVIAILGILASIAVPTFSGIQAKSRVKAEIATAQTIIHEARTMQADKSADGNTAVTDAEVPSAQAPGFALTGGGTGKYVVTWTTKGGGSVADGIKADFAGLAVTAASGECVLTEQ